MESHLMIAMVSEHQLSIVEHINIAQESQDDQDLDLTLVEDLPFMAENDLDYGHEMTW